MKFTYSIDLTSQIHHSWRIQTNDFIQNANPRAPHVISECGLRKVKRMTCGAVTPSRVLGRPGFLYGNMDITTPHGSEISQVITMKLCTFDHVRKTNTFAKFGWNPSARDCSTHTWNIHVLRLFFPLSCLLAFFSCAPAQAKRIEIISRTVAQKTQQVFFSHLTFLGHFAPKLPQFYTGREIPAK